MTKEEAIAQVNGPLGTVMREVSAFYAVPFIWGTPGMEVRNGSAFFWRSDNAILLGVTASHNYEAYLEVRARSAGVVCQLGTDVTIDISKRLIDCRRNLKEPDIATFHVTEEEVTSAQKWVFSMSPCTPEVGKGVFFAGFPAAAREQVGSASYNLGIMSGLVVASSVNDRDITCHFEREYMVAAPSGPCDFGGVSGAFLAAVIDRNQQLSLWRPAGVVYEFQPSLEILKAHRLDTNLLPDGRIKR